MSVQMICFDSPAMSFDAFLAELERASSDPNDIHIFNFGVQIAHAVPNIGGGHFSLLADYDRQTQELLVADTNPKKYTRYWKCPAKRMYDVCVDKDSSSTRPRGMLILRKGDAASTAAGKHGKDKSDKPAPPDRASPNAAHVRRGRRNTRDPRRERGHARLPAIGPPARRRQRTAGSRIAGRGNTQPPVPRSEWRGSYASRRALRLALALACRPMSMTGHFRSGHVARLLDEGTMVCSGACGRSCSNDTGIRGGGELTFPSRNPVTAGHGAQISRRGAKLAQA